MSLHNYVLECENCHGDVVYQIANNTAKGAVGLAGGAATGAVIGSLIVPIFGTAIGGFIGAAGGANAGIKDKGGVCQSCGAIYPPGQMRKMRQKPTFTLPGNAPSVSTAMNLLVSKPQGQRLCISCGAPITPPMSSTTSMFCSKACRRPGDDPNDVATRHLAACRLRAEQRQKSFRILMQVLISIALMVVAQKVGESLNTPVAIVIAISTIAATAIVRHKTRLRPAWWFVGLLLFSLYAGYSDTQREIKHQQLHEENVARHAAKMAVHQSEEKPAKRGNLIAHRVMRAKLTNVLAQTNLEVARTTDLRKVVVGEESYLFPSLKSACQFINQIATTNSATAQDEIAKSLHVAYIDRGQLYTELGIGVITCTAVGPEEYTHVRDKSSNTGWIETSNLE